MNAANRAIYNEVIARLKRDRERLADPVTIQDRVRQEILDIAIQDMQMRLTGLSLEQEEAA